MSKVSLAITTTALSAVAALGLAVAPTAHADAPAPAPSASAAKPNPSRSAPSADGRKPGPSTGESGTSGAVRGPHARMAADGYFYAYRDEGFTGQYCKWTGNNYDWTRAGECGNYNDVASSVWNNGFPSTVKNVWLLKHWGGPSAEGQTRMCLSNGDYWGYLHQQIEKFADGTKAWDEISGHAWTARSC